MSPEKEQHLAQERDKYNRFAPKFKPEFVETVREMRKSGSTVAMIADACGVSISAIKKWKSPYSKYFNADFAIAWDIASAGFVATYDAQAISQFTNANFNAVLFSMFMRNNSDWTEHRKLDLPELADATTFKEQKKELSKLLAGERVTAHEINYLTRCISDLNQLEQIEKLQKEVDELKFLIKKGSNYGETDTSGESRA